MGKKPGEDERRPEGDVFPVCQILTPPLPPPQGGIFKEPLSLVKKYGSDKNLQTSFCRYICTDAWAPWGAAMR